MPTSAGLLFGGGGAPIGAIVTGQYAANPDYLPCDGKDYLKSVYPELNYTGMETFGSNAVVPRTLPTSQVWFDIAFGNGVFVAVGCGTDSTTATTSAASSTDGANWTARTIPSGAYHSVIYAAGLFVAVGINVCATSPDGVTWTARTLGGTLTYGAIAYGAGLFVVSVRGDGASSYYTSPDGITWTTRTLPKPSNHTWSYAGVVWDDFNSRFVLYTYYNQSTAQYIFALSESEDGINWGEFSYGPVRGAIYNVTPFKDRLYFTGAVSGYGTQPLVTDPTAQSQLLSNGTVNVALGGRVLSFRGYRYNFPADCFSSAGGWLFFSESSTLWYSTDGLRWDMEKLPVAMSGSQVIRSAYGNGVLAMITQFPSYAGASANTAAYSWAVDTTRFKVPGVTPTTAADRLYLKAK